MEGNSYFPEENSERSEYERDRGSQPQNKEVDPWWPSASLVSTLTLLHSWLLHIYLLVGFTLFFINKNKKARLEIGVKVCHEYFLVVPSFSGGFSGHNWLLSLFLLVTRDRLWERGDSTLRRFPMNDQHKSSLRVVITLFLFLCDSERRLLNRDWNLLRVDWPLTADFEFELKSAQRSTVNTKKNALHPHRPHDHPFTNSLVGRCWNHFSIGKIRVTRLH